MLQGTPPRFDHGVRERQFREGEHPAQDACADELVDLGVHVPNARVRQHDRSGLGGRRPLTASSRTATLLTGENVSATRHAAPFSGTPRPAGRDGRDEYLRSTVSSAQRRAYGPAWQPTIGTPVRCSGSHAAASNIQSGASSDRQFRWSARPHRHTVCSHLVSTSYTMTERPNHGCHGYRTSRDSVLWVLRCRLVQDHRPQRALTLTPTPPEPTRPPSAPAPEWREARIQRPDRLGGVVREYVLAA
jgi:hypothetical protein